MLTFMNHIFILDKVHSLKDGNLDFNSRIQKFHLGCYSEKSLLPLIVTFNPRRKCIHNIDCSILFDKGDGSPIQAFDVFPALYDYSVADLVILLKDFLIMNKCRIHLEIKKFWKVCGYFRIHYI